MRDARRNDEIISLADSQMLRWIDELNGVFDADEKARELKKRIKMLRKERTSRQVKQELRDAYEALDELQFKPDYMCLIIDRTSDYHRACKGFTINGIQYQRLLGTNGGIKNSTIVFVSERLAPELRRRVDNGRDLEKPLVTAKLEAYKALTCSASRPVSFPKGVLIVDDAQTEFTSDIVFLSDESNGEPDMEVRRNSLIQMDASDGYGLILPSLAERWSDELGIGYVASGFNTRMSWEKGMVIPFDYVDFAERIAGSYVVRDAWGNEVDVRNVEMILTTSMVKLWDSYRSCDDYINESKKNHYTFCVTKQCPEVLENERRLNYQFIQSYNLSDDDIDELIEPTMQEIRDVLGGDWRKTVLFLKGIDLNERGVDRLENDFIKAMMVDKRIADDPFVHSCVYQLIKNRIDEAKVGSLKVHGNYTIICGDPYLLCQSIFGMEQTGLLSSGEIYNEYWVNYGADRLACFRAPMTCHSNIRAVRPVGNEEVRYWFRYLHTITVFNGWDTAAAALNGADFDSDAVMLTDNRVLVRRLEELPALMCAQRRAEKRVSSDDDFVRSNIESFGNDIGQTTNWVTSMFEVQSRFTDDSDEYRILAYRIQCGQLYQQNAIDKAKGIVCKPMPKTWHDRHAVSEIEDEGQRELYRRIIADKKPYFMRYIYPDLMRKYNTYISNTNKKSLREFQMTVSELTDLDEEKLTDRQREFLTHYYRRIPVGIGPCVMNKICRKFEEAFDGHVGRYASSSEFDYRFMRSNAEYTQRQYREIKRIRDEYNRRIRSYAMFAACERVDEYDSFAQLMAMNDDFLRECSMICTDEKSLCNILLDLCYQRSATKRFVWNLCGDRIVQNLLDSNEHIILYPSRDDNGDLSYCGVRFSVKQKRMENVNGNCAE